MVVLLDPFRGMGAWRNSTETHQSGHAPRSRPEVKNGRSSAKDSAPESSDVWQSRRRWVRSCSGCPQALHEEFSFRFTCIGKRTREGCDCDSEVGQFTADKRGRASSSEETEGIWQERELSPQRVASVSNFCNGRSRGAGNMGNGECYSGFGKRVCPFISRKSSMTEDPLEV